jgi:hypothetical protein
MTFTTLAQAIQYSKDHLGAPDLSVRLAEVFGWAMEEGDWPKWFPKKCMLEEAICIYRTLWDHAKDMRNRDHLLQSLRETYGGRLPAPAVLRAVMDCALRDHENQRFFIKSVMRAQNDEKWCVDECPIKIADIPGKGRGLVAKRDIKEGEIVGLYPVDWVMYGDQHFDYIKKKPNECRKQGGKLPFEDQHTWNMYNALLGTGDLYNEENFNLIEGMIRDNDGIITKELETYGYTSHGKTAPENEQWRGYEDLVSETWAHPKIKHPNPWAIIHMGNDGVYYPGITKEEYKAENSRNGLSAIPGDFAVNINLDFVSIAVRDIKAGEEIQDSYGENYWFNGIVTKDMEATLDRKNKGRVKKHKARYKKMDKDRKESWRTLHDLIMRSYNDEDEIHKIYDEDPLSFHIVVNEEGRTMMAQHIRRTED